MQLKMRKVDDNPVSMRYSRVVHAMMTERDCFQRFVCTLDLKAVTELSVKVEGFAKAGDRHQPRFLNRIIPLFVKEFVTVSDEIDALTAAKDALELSFQQAYVAEFNDKEGAIDAKLLQLVRDREVFLKGRASAAADAAGMHD